MVPISPEAPPTAGPAIFGEAPPGASLVLAGLDIGLTVWLVCVYVVLTHVAAKNVGQWTSGEDDWFGVFGITMLFALLVFVISVASLVKEPVRAEPRIFRVLFGGTIALALAVALPFTLPYVGQLFWQT